MTRHLCVLFFLFAGFFGTYAHATDGSCEVFMAAVKSSNSSDYVLGMISKYSTWAEEIATGISLKDGSTLNDIQVESRAEKMGMLGRQLRVLVVRFHSALGGELINQIASVLRRYGHLESPRPQPYQRPGHQ